MFSSPLPYKRADEHPPSSSSSSRYAEALPPPVPASPLRNPPPPQPVHANTYYPPPSHPHAQPPPPLNHAYTAPAGWTRSNSQQQEHGWTGMDSAWSSSRPVLIDRHSEVLQTEQMPTGREVEIGEESEASKLVRMMSRSRHSRPLSQAPTTAVPSFPIQNDGWPPPQAQSISGIQQVFEQSSGRFPLTLSPNETDNSAGYFQPAQYQPYQPDQQHQQQQQQHVTYSNTYRNTNTRHDVELFQINSSSITTTTTRRRYPLSPFPEQEVDSRTVSGSATPLPPYAVYPQSQPSSSFQAPPPPPQQQQQHAQTERQHGFHLAGDVKFPASTSSEAHPAPPPPTTTPSTTMTTNNAETPKWEEYHVLPLPSSSSYHNNNRSSTNSHTHDPTINPNDLKSPHHHHHHGRNKNSTGTGTWTGTGTGTCADIVLGGMTMPNAQEYASIPSYGASSLLTSDDSSYYSSSDSESENSDSALDADEAGSGRQVDSAREREGRPSGTEWEANEEDQGRQRQWERERERHNSFPSLHSQPDDDDDDDRHQQQAQQTDLQALSQPTSQPQPQPASQQLERAGSIAAASIHSFKAGDEVGLLASNPAERGQQVKPKETAGLGKGQASDAVLGVSAGEDRGKRTLIYSYHPPPTDLPATATSEQPSEIPLFCAPTSFQLLGQSLKRLLADLMVSASTSFVPAPSAYASSCAETPVWRVEVWVRTFTLPVPPVAGALVVGKRVAGGAKHQGKRWMVGGGYRTMVGIELDEQVARPSLAMMTSRSSGVGGTALALTRTRSSRYSHSGVTDNEQQQQQIAGSTLPAKPAATSSDSTNTLLPTFTASHVLRLRLPIPLQTPFTAAQLVETLHKHYQYGKRVGRSTTTSLAAGTVEENAYSFARMVDRAPGPVDEAARLSKAHKLGRTAFWDGRAVPTAATPDERAGEDIQGQVGRKGFRYTMRKAVSKAVGAVQGEREDTVEDDRANWVTPFTG